MSGKESAEYKNNKEESNMSDNLVIEGYLEIDKFRGVLYFNSKHCTNLRVCGLKVPKEFSAKDCIDITTDKDSIVSYAFTYNEQEPGTKKE
jgi:hypothetical protein